MTNPRENRKIRVLIVDDIAETRDNLKKLLYFEDDVEVVGVGASGREGVELVDEVHPDVVLMDINMPGMDGITASETISEQHPEVQVIMMSVQGEADYLRRSMLAGAREFLIKPFSSEELATSIRRVHQLAASRRVVSAPPPPVFQQPGAAPLAPVPVKPQGGKIIAVFSPKGGTGVSTIAVNLAVAIKEETKERVAIVDGSYQFGDVGVLLNLPGNRSVADIVESKTEADEDLLNGVMPTHASGVRALLAPPRPEMAELIGPEQVKSILGVLRKLYDYVVVDTAKNMNDAQMAILDAADQIVLVSTADIAALKDVKLFFEVTDALAYPDSKIMLVLARYDGRSGINPKDIEANIKHSISTSVPRDDRTVNGALSQGIPFVLAQRSAVITQAILRLARAVQRDAEESRQESAAARGASTPALAHNGNGKSRPGTKPEDPKAKRGVFSVFGRG